MYLRYVSSSANLSKCYPDISVAIFVFSLRVVYLWLFISLNINSCEKKDASVFMTHSLICLDIYLLQHIFIMMLFLIEFHSYFHVRNR